ncbi:MoaD family protein [Nitrosomonas sp. sh817]|uniref:MoaD family protein n=1 Tax=Nitrosomonas sp. sh817 TaxID=3070658 RepID=UPI0027DE595B|nr:MoaD family protein [Nitrosomonas sp. sh817]WMJ09796.1 MoaD family protein [Nitrosomonas sp. sh817]
MSIKVIIPTILRPLTNQQKHIHVDGFAVSEVIDRMDQQYPGIKAKLVSEASAHRFINIYVNDHDIRFQAGLATPLQEGDVMTILPAVAGG